MVTLMSEPVREIIIQGRGIKRDQVAKLKDFLASKFSERVAEINRDGKEIKIRVLDPSKISKTKLRPYIKRFIYHEGLRGEVKVLSAGADALLLHRKGGIEPVEEEVEEEKVKEEE